MNLITATEKQIVRDIFEIYARETGIEFIENTGQTGGLSIGKGDLRALDPMIGPTSGVAGLGGPGRVVLNQDSFASSNRFYGDSFTGTMYHEIGHALSLGHAYDIPAVQGTGPIPNEVLPGDADLLHLKRLSPPNSTDIDLYKFTLPSGGQLKAEILAERLNTPSLLNSALRLYKLNSITNRYELLAQNDQYFGADAFINLHLDAGTYQIGVGFGQLAGKRGHATFCAQALQHHLVSPYTALIAVDTRPTRPAQTPSSNSAVPVLAPNTQTSTAVAGTLPQTATGALLHLMIGLFLAVLALLIAARNPVTRWS